MQEKDKLYKRMKETVPNYKELMKPINEFSEILKKVSGLKPLANTSKVVRKAPQSIEDKPKKARKQGIRQLSDIEEESEEEPPEPAVKVKKARKQGVKQEEGTLILNSEALNVSEDNADLSDDQAKPKKAKKQGARKMGKVVHLGEEESELLDNEIKEPKGKRAKKQGMNVKFGGQESDPEQEEVKSESDAELDVLVTKSLEPSPVKEDIVRPKRARKQRKDTPLPQLQLGKDKTDVSSFSESPLKMNQSDSQKSNYDSENEEESGPVIKKEQRHRIKTTSSKEDSESPIPSIDEENEPKKIIKARKSGSSTSKNVSSILPTESEETTGEHGQQEMEQQPIRVPLVKNRRRRKVRDNVRLIESDEEEEYDAGKANLKNIKHA